MKSSKAIILANVVIKNFEKNNIDNKITLEDKIQVFRTAAMVVDEELIASNQAKYRKLIEDNIKRRTK